MDDLLEELLVDRKGFGYLSHCGEPPGMDGQLEQAYQFHEDGQVTIHHFGVAVTRQRHPWRRHGKHVTIDQNLPEGLGPRTLYDFNIVSLGTNDVYLVPVNHYTLTSKWTMVISEILVRGGDVATEMKERHEKVHPFIFRRMKTTEGARERLPVD